MSTLQTVPIDFKQYDPKNIVLWDTYVQIKNEYIELQKAVLRRNKPYLIESEKGQGKTLAVHTLCKNHNIALVTEPVGSGTTKYDLIGHREINSNGTTFELGLLPRAIEVANEYKHALLYGDEANAQDHDTQRWWNSICDGRASVVANGKTYRLNEGCKLSIVWTVNPITYAGINTMTEDLRSRFTGTVWEYPSSDELKRIVDWTGIDKESIREPLLQFIQDVYAFKVKNEVDYALSIRDVTQFCDFIRSEYDDSEEHRSQTSIIKEAIKQVLLIKFGDPTERELVRIRATDTFGVSL